MDWAKQHGNREREDIAHFHASVGPIGEDYVSSGRSGTGRRDRCTGIVLLLVLLASLIAYKVPPALRAIRTARAASKLAPRPYPAGSVVGMTPALLWTESISYLRIVWPALVFGIIISAAAKVAIPQDWLAPVLTRHRLSSAPVVRHQYSRAHAAVRCVTRNDASGTWAESSRADVDVHSFHRGISLMLLFLAFLISVIEILRQRGLEQASLGTLAAVIGAACLKLAATVRVTT